MNIKNIEITNDQIQAKVKEIADNIIKDYKGKDLFMIALLKGALPYLTDLSKQIGDKVNLRFGFMQTHYFENKQTGASGVMIIKDLRESIENKSVLLVEDIIGKANTINYIIKNLKLRKPKEFKITSIFIKNIARKENISIDYPGFYVEDKYYVGYGLDYKGFYRNLKCLAVLNK